MSLNNGYLQKVEAASQNFQIVVDSEKSTYETVNGNLYLVMSINYPYQTPDPSKPSYSGVVGLGYQNYSNGLYHENDQGSYYSVLDSMGYLVRLKFKDGSTVGVDSSLSTRANRTNNNILTKLYFNVAGKNLGDIDYIEGYLPSKGAWYEVKRFFVIYEYYIGSDRQVFQIYKGVSYIRNVPPTLTITTPADNQTLSEATRPPSSQ
ncbi:hypothetical protein ABHN11_24630 [Brevibacillus centrosporus]|uniref:hypothetical protein n=1 Tax=Brevibacillus centrosporus TaxID=54910 RepID=UPI003D1B27EA